MQGWHYGKGLIYYRPIFQLTKLAFLMARAGLFEGGLRYPRVSANFELRYESLKSQFSWILFAYNLMIGYAKKNTENYQRECFW